MKGSSLLGRLTTQGVTDPEGIWGVDKTAPGRGGGPGACLSEALGGIRTRRGDGAGLKRAWRPLRFWTANMGARPAFQNANHACNRGKNAYAAGGTNSFSLKPRDALPQSSQWLHGRPAQTLETAPAKTGSAAACIRGAIARRPRIARRAG